MPYLPPSVINPTVFPVPVGNDLALQVRLIEESYRRFYPLINYFRLNQTPEETFDMTTGVPPATIVDDLWNEPLPAGSAGGWVQPHSNDSADNQAPNHMQFHPPIEINAYIEEFNLNTDADRTGLDERREMRMVFAASILDTNGIEVRRGDRVEWGTFTYEVMEVKRDRGRWGRTNIWFYVTAVVARVREGS